MPFSADLPDPPVPADCDLRGLDWMPWYGSNLAGSEFEATVSDAVFRAAVLLWWAAWQQVPASSVPDDDAVLTKLCGLGRDVRKFRKMRDQILHGFVKCSDGRLYHRFLSLAASDAWKRTQARHQRTKAASAARWPAVRNGELDDIRNGARNGSHTIHYTQETLSEGKEPNGSSPSDSSCPNGHSPPASAREVNADFEAFWAVYPRKVGKYEARRKYAIARRTASADDILDAARRYAAAMVDAEKRYIVHPARWLHTGRWQDEDVEVQQRRKSPLEKLYEGAMRAADEWDERKSGSNGADCGPAYPLLDG